MEALSLSGTLMWPQGTRADIYLRENILEHLFITLARWCLFVHSSTTWKKKPNPPLPLPPPPPPAPTVLSLRNLTTEFMVYSWGLFWPRELGVLNQRRISPSFYGPRGGKTGRQANEITDLDRIITSLKEREREETISLTCSASPIRPSDHHHLIFSAASSVYMRPRGGMCVSVSRCCHMPTCMHICRPPLQMMLPIWKRQELAVRLCQLCVTENPL